MHIRADIDCVLSGYRRLEKAADWEVPNGERVEVWEKVVNAGATGS